MEEMKTCRKCGETFPATSQYWHRNRASKDGLMSECKECHCESSRQWRQANPERSRQWAQAHPERMRELSRQWQKDNSERYRAKSRQWREANPERLCENTRRWLEDPRNHFVNAFNNYISRSLNGNRNGRLLVDLVGYSREDLLEHMEAQFADGMTFDNHGQGPGKWQMHHRSPVSSFDFEDPDDPEFKECWALGNLTPMWHEDHVAIHSSASVLAT